MPEAATLDEVLAAMREHRTQMAIVMDEHGGTAGLISIEDLFEEVIGEIHESWRTQPSVVRDDQGRLVVDGTVRLEDVGEMLGIALEHEDVDTVSGLVLTELGRPPVVGDSLIYDHVEFIVLAIEGHGVARCRVSPVSEPDPDDSQQERE